MKRLTEYTRFHGSMLPVLNDSNRYSAIERLAAIEDILGDEYELTQIGKVIHCKDCAHMWAEAEFPGECYCRMLGEVVPFDGFCHKGKAALKAREQDEH